MKNLVALACTLLAVAVSVTGHAAGSARADIIVQLDPSSILDAQFGSSPPASLQLSSGFVMLGTDDASCTTSGCKVTLNALAVTLSDFTASVAVTSESGTMGTADALVSQPTLNIFGPVQLTNDGRGFVVPAGTPIQSSAVVSATVHLSSDGLRLSPTWLATFGTLSAPLVLAYQVVPHEAFTLSGSFPFELKGNQTVSGQRIDIDLAGSAQVLGSGLTPFVNVSPCALVHPTFFGARGVTIEEGATVNGTIYSGPGGQVTIENEATVGGIVSLSPVALKNRVTVGTIDTNAELIQGHNDHVGSVSSATPPPLTFPRLSQRFSGTQAVQVSPHDTLTLSPGQYGDVKVSRHGQLVLSAGAYSFTSLEVDRDAALVTPSPTSETVQVFVRDKVIYRGSTRCSTGSAAPLYLAYVGTSPISIKRSFTGTIVAPNAKLALRSRDEWDDDHDDDDASASYVGEFIAQEIRLVSQGTVSSNPFSCR